MKTALIAVRARSDWIVPIYPALLEDLTNLLGAEVGYRDNECDALGRNPIREEEIGKRWKKEDVALRSVKQRVGNVAAIL